MAKIVVLLLLSFTVAHADPPTEMQRGEGEIIKGNVLFAIGIIHATAGLGLCSVDGYELAQSGPGFEWWPFFTSIGLPIFLLGSSLSIAGIVYSSRGHNRQRRARETVSLAPNQLGIRF